jgi:hypothetical protein
VERPYEPLGISTEKWRIVHPQRVRISTLTPTNDTYGPWVEEKFDCPWSSYCGDPYPHVVVYHRLWYIQDGHHRIEAARRQGMMFIYARVLYTAM